MYDLCEWWQRGTLRSVNYQSMLRWQTSSDYRHHAQELRQLLKKTGLLFKTFVFSG